MVYAININPNALETLSQKSGAKTQTENVGFGFFEKIKETLQKENRLQVFNKEESERTDFLKPETEPYKKFVSEEEETEKELVSKLQEILNQMKDK